MARSRQLADFFRPIVGHRPWQAKRGWGSFLTFEFGPKIRDNGHMHGSWHLWIYQCDWELRSRGRTVAHSETNKHAIDLAIRRLESVTLNRVGFDPKSGETKFVFGHMELVTRPYSDSEIEHEMSDSEYWMFFMPDNQVLSIGRSNKPEVGPASRQVTAPAR